VEQIKIFAKLRVLKMMSTSFLIKRMLSSWDQGLTTNYYFC
jgi:hypothetical protein